MNSSQKRVVILIDNSYQEMEVWYPYFRLQEYGAAVEFAGAIAGHVYESSWVSRQGLASAMTSFPFWILKPSSCRAGGSRSNPQIS